jgi:hypothetical protein
MLIDDFSSASARSFLGNKWIAFSDAVMGGVSEEHLAFVVLGALPCLLLSGQVKLDNGGGFIQAALPLVLRERAFDATAFAGLRLRVAAAPGSYFIHLRTADCLQPWHHYVAPLETSEGWRDIDVPFEAFKRSGGGVRDLDKARLTRVGLVAGKQVFEANLAVARIEFYRADASENPG